MPALIVTLPASLPTATTLCDTVLTDDGIVVTRHAQTPLSLFPTLTGGEIVAMVPAAQLSWHRVDLPKGTLDRGLFQDGNATRLRSVLDGLLEDRLLDEPEQLHFAIDPQARSGEPVWVAVCNRAWLNAWLQTLDQAGKPVSRIVPETEPSPLSAEAEIAATVQIIGTADAAHLVCSDDSGVSLLPLSSATVALLGSRCDGPVVAEPAVSTLAEHHFPGRVSLLTAPQRALVSAQSAWDLAQFDLLRTRRTRTRKQLSSLFNTALRAPQWKPARWAGVALVLVNLLGLQAWAWKEQTALAAKKASIRDVLTNTFPDVRVVVDAPLQMERSLANLQRQSGAASSADLEAMLGRFQAVALELPAMTAIEFAAGELRLKYSGPVDAQLPNVVTRMQTFGYAVHLRDGSVVIQQEKRP